METRTPAVKRATSLVLNLIPLRFILGEKRDIEHDSAEEVKCSDNLQEKGNATQSYISQNDEKHNVTLKTWYMVMVLALPYGISFWIIPSLSSI